jgi:hypothetical protein
MVCFGLLHKLYSTNSTMEQLQKTWSKWSTSLGALTTSPFSFSSRVRGAEPVLIKKVKRSEKNVE